MKRPKEPICRVCHRDPNGFLKSFPLSGVMNLSFKRSSPGVCLSNPDPLQPLVPPPHTHTHTHTHAPADACPDDQHFTAPLNKTPRNETGHKMAPPPAHIAGAGWERERQRGAEWRAKDSKTAKRSHLCFQYFLFSIISSLPYVFFLCISLSHLLFSSAVILFFPLSTSHKNTYYWGDKGRECREETGGCVWGMRESQEWNPVFPLHWA